MTPFYEDDIAVVGMGCVFPDAPDCAKFWAMLVEGHAALGNAPADRWPEALYGDPSPDAEDKTYSSHGAFVSQTEYRRLCREHSLDPKETNRLQIFTLEAARQALASVPEALRKSRRVGWYLGCLGPDDQFSAYKFLLEEPKLRAYVARLPSAERKEAERILEETLQRLKSENSQPLGLILPTQVFPIVEKRFGLSGEHCFVDAACASSLAAVDVAMRKLRAGECDLALTGGVETELPPEQFVLFSKLGLMARGNCLPFDEATEGVNQGEGAAVFALARLADAVRYGVAVRAVLRGCGGSSNGRGSSLFSPTAEGQRLALERAYAGGKPSRLDFLECHATGTRLGDAIEIDTVDAFFEGAVPPIPLGSVKALIGHTKGAAGAAGLLKCILAMEHRTAPPSPYFMKYLEGRRPKAVYVNAKPEPLAATGTLRAGVSAAGFGGTNFHLFLETFDPQTALSTRERPESGPLAVLATAYVPREGFLDVFPDYGFKIPPNNLAQIDACQLLSLMAVSEALDRSGLDLRAVPRERISVLSSSSLGLEAWLSCRVRHFEFARGRAMNAPGLSALLEHRRNYPRITEDAGPGTLNNVIAGRVANQFDFHGPNFHVDSELGSFACALGVARLALWQGVSDLVIVLGIEDTVDDSIPDVIKSGVHCLVLSRPLEGRQPLFHIESIDFAA